VSQFPHADIPDQGKTITADLSPFTRDEPEYWRNPPSDHTVEGLFASATEGDGCSLAELIPFTFCTLSAPTPEGERRRHVVNTSRRVSNGGRYSRPVKPANSGRKRRAA
jgi:hypothetical protein